MKSKAEIKRFYDKAYSKNRYGGERPLSESRGRGSNIKKALEEFCTLDKRSVVLEIGCGEGIQMEAVADHVKEVHGIDISDVAIKNATDFLKEKSNCFLYVGDNIESFPDSHFDAIWEQTVFQHMLKKHVLEYFEQTRRKLKSGGHVLFQFIHDPRFDELEDDGCENRSSWTEDEFTKEMKRSGFTVVDIKSVGVVDAPTTVYYVIGRKS